MIAVVGVYCIFVGTLMVIWWTVSLRRGAGGRPDRSQSEMTFHLVAEFVTAMLLVVSGITLLASGDSAIPIAALALGMLLYTVIVSPGYFIARRELAPACMFGGLALLTGAAAVVLIT